MVRKRNKMDVHQHENQSSTSRMGKSWSISRVFIYGHGRSRRPVIREFDLHLSNPHGILYLKYISASSTNDKSSCIRCFPSSTTNQHVPYTILTCYRWPPFLSLQNSRRPLRYYLAAPLPQHPPFPRRLCGNPPDAEQRRPRRCLARLLRCHYRPNLPRRLRWHD